MFKNLMVLAACLTLVTSVGCANIEAKGKTAQLQDRTRAYRKAVRWSEFEIASTYVRRRDQSEYHYDSDFLDGIRVTSIEITERDVRLEDDEAIVKLEISYYHEDGGVVKEIVDAQTWWYDVDAEQWYLDGTFPDFSGGL